MRFPKGLVPFMVVFSAVGVHAATYVVPKDEVLIGQSDAIVIARALHSHVQESSELGIETFTVFAVEEVLKGDIALANGIRVREPGGMVVTKNNEKRFKVIPGGPRFVDGDRVLLFVRKVGAEDFATTDMALGFFGFATDDLGNRVLIRNDTEIIGWDPDGTVHHEARRSADRFLKFIRDVVNDRPVTDHYTIKANPLTGGSGSITTMRLQPRPLTVFTVTQYTLPSGADVNGNPTTPETSVGFRWSTFPSAINFNRGNTEINAPNGGSDAINAAISSWNGDAASNVNYVLASTTSNLNGYFEGADGVNNVVFEKDLTAHGFPAFSCSIGGLLGYGGITSGGGTTNTVNGETFFGTFEGDVSMNQGLGACLPAGGGSFPIEHFNSAVTHEIGHTLGFRHAEKSRDNSQACTSFAGYDCANSAIMESFVAAGLAAALQPWDQRAVEALYPGSGPPAAPANVVATATTTTSVHITWTASAGATSYTVSRTANNSTYTTVGTPATNSLTDSPVTAGTSYLYKVTATNASGTSGDSNKDLATTVIFTDPTLTAQSTLVKAVHLTQLRTAVNAVRKLANGGAANNFSFTDATITAQTTLVKRIHIIDLRSALNPARATLGLTALSYTDPTITAGTTLVKAAHFTDLRKGVQ